MKQRLWWGFLLLSLAAIPVLFTLRGREKTVHSPSSVSLPILGRLPEFRLTDQTGRLFGSNDLRGHVWLADFIFTSCAGVCPRMTDQMASLQKELPLEIHLVSMTVDPARDIPAVLQQYADRYGADPARWHFLTGPEKTLRELIHQGFRLGYAEGGGPEEPIVHSQRFVLVDSSLNIRGYYDSTEPEAVARLVRDARTL